MSVACAPRALRVFGAPRSRALMTTDERTPIRGWVAASARPVRRRGGGDAKTVQRWDDDDDDDDDADDDEEDDRG